MDENNKPIGKLLGDLWKMFRNYIDQRSIEMGINGSYTFIFLALSHHKDGLAQNEICNILNLKAPTISLTIQNMEREGLLVRQKDKIDSRKTIVKITKKGAEYDEKIKKIHKEAEEKITNSLNKEEYLLVQGLIKKMCDTLECGGACNDKAVKIS